MLKLLDVSFNMIQKVPDEIGSATSLVKLAPSPINEQLGLVLSILLVALVYRCL